MPNTGLTINEKEEELNKAAEKREQEELSLVIEQIENNEQAWGANKSSRIVKDMKHKSRELGSAVMSRSTKREPTNTKGARSKKLKYATLGEDWGAKNSGEKTYQ